MYFLAFPFPEQAISEEIREREWANVVTAHLHNSKVRTWNTVKGALDSVVLNAKVEPVSPAVSREGSSSFLALKILKGPSLFDSRGKLSAVYI